MKRHITRSNAYSSSEMANSVKGATSSKAANSMRGPNISTIRWSISDWRLPTGKKQSTPKVRPGVRNLAERCAHRSQPQRVKRFVTSRC